MKIYNFELPIPRARLHSVLDGSLKNRQDVDLDLSLRLDLSGRGRSVEESLGGVEGGLEGLCRVGFGIGGLEEGGRRR